MRSEPKKSLQELIKSFGEGLSIAYDVLTMAVLAAGRREERRTEGGIIEGD